jgi:GH15 family glucan-1,4-alpha-glucosidase
MTDSGAAATGWLIDRSLEALAAGQHPSGALIASPDFRPYHFCWVRDGTFCAYALDRWGRHQAAARFYRFVAKAINDFMRGQGLESDGSTNSAFPPTRFTLEGQVADDGWPNFQLDGYGTWLWGLSEHARLSGSSRLWDEFAQPIEFLCRQLEHLWPLPCFDCWEEDGERVHTSTLACIATGLHCAGSATNRLSASRAAEAIDTFVAEHAVLDGRLVKSIGRRSIDASLLWLSMPFPVAPLEEAVRVETAEAVRSELGYPGISRYQGDRYYGGGSWPLLTAWYGWCCVSADQSDDARQCLAWIEEQAGPDGSLPEQVDGIRRDPFAYQEWVRQGGRPARQLLWSHAMYLVLADELGCHAGQAAVP